MLRMNLLTYRDLWRWLDLPYGTPVAEPVYQQMTLFENLLNSSVSVSVNKDTFYRSATVMRTEVTLRKKGMTLKNTCRKRWADAGKSDDPIFLTRKTTLFR